MTDPVPPTEGPGRVQSTATGELMQKLATAPKLDQQRFVLEGEVGKGGMGAVLRIHDRYLNRRLAMKVLLERAAPQDDEERRFANQLLGRFLEEAQVTSQLDHPGVVPVHELGLDQNGKVWFTMRLVKGRTASDVFADAREEVNGWTTTRALEVVLKVCDTMAYAHDKAVLHRDLKPGNVMVGRFGEVYVMDWGLAKVLGQQDRHDLRIAKDPGTSVSKIESTRQRDAARDESSSVVSMDGQQLGTPSYMPPEQARSEDLDARADVYAIGAMMYELLTGQAPYEVPGLRQPAYRILRDVVDGPPKRIDDVRPRRVPAELVAIVERAMARRREGRYPTVIDLAADLRAFVALRVVRAYRTGPWVETKLWMRRNKALASSLLALAAALLIGVVGTTWLLFELRAENTKQRVGVAADLLVEALRLEPGLYPAFPDNLPAMGEWLRNFGDPLTTMWPQLQSDLQTMRLVRGRTDAGPQSVAGYVFDDPGDRFVHSRLTRLVDDLRSFIDKHYVQDVRARIAEAQTVAGRSIEGPLEGKWREAIDAIRASDGVGASKAYDHLPIGPKLGLVPIGMDKDSLLWEFVHLASGTRDKEVPPRGPDGQLQPNGDMGIVFVLVPGRRAAANEPDSVALEPFFLSKYELTIGQWLRIGGESALVPSRTGAGSFVSGIREIVEHCRADDPRLVRPAAVMQSFDECEVILHHQGFLLPTQQQWDFASSSDPPTPPIPDHPSQTPPVGWMPPNALGIHEMHAGLSEWCSDRWDANPNEATGPSSDKEIVHASRGGAASWGVEDKKLLLRVSSPGSWAFCETGIRPVKMARTSNSGQGPHQLAPLDHSRRR